MPIAIFALTLSAFAICTIEHGIAGLLPTLSTDLAISIPTAGLLVTFYALGVAIGGPFLAVLTARFPEKGVLLTFMAVFIAGNVVCALAPNYESLAVARVIVACGHGVFFGIAMVVAGNLMPHARGTAVALIFAGVTSATLLGIPAGTAIGNAFGWRATFWAVSAVAAIGLVAIALLVPRSEAKKPGDRVSLGAQLRALNHPHVYLTQIVIILLLTGGVALQTYLVPLMIEVTGIPLEQTPWFLLILGSGALVGGIVGGRLADWKLMPTFIAVTFGQVFLQFAIVFTSTSPVLLAINLFLQGAVGFAWGAHATNRVLSAATAAPNLAATLNNTAFNLGIALGAWLGGVAISAGVGYQSLPYIPVVLQALAGAVLVVSMLLDKPRTRPAAAAGPA